MGQPRVGPWPSTNITNEVNTCYRIEAAMSMA
jgi:hypothetical protein